MNREKAVKLQAFILTDRIGHCVMQDIEGGYLYCNNHMMIRIEEEFAVLNLPKVTHLSDIFNVPVSARSVISSHYCVSFDNKIGTFIKFLDNNNLSIWMDKKYYTITKKLAKEYWADDSRLYVIDETGLRAVIGLVRKFSKICFKGAMKGIKI